MISVLILIGALVWFSNEINIENQNPNTNLIPWYWDCELSPNKRYLYVSQEFTLFDTANYLLRFDLQAANIPASRDTLYIGEHSSWWFVRVSTRW
ncbi:MAG: hypothetical protein IPP29_00280 [Bacteroidetes bacterium]|nr:hypothetical protein [Bacteroidota bacterium]